MKIGFQLNFLDFRNDVRRVIQIISRNHEVVLFIRAADINVMKPYIQSQIELRIIDEKIPSLKNRIFETLYNRFAKLPKSTNNYYLQERFLLTLIKNKRLRNRSLFLLNLSMKLPRFFSYDKYLNLLNYSGNTRIDDIDKFICLTRISDDYFFSRLIKENKNVQVYVYSWDHACKHPQFSKNVKYMVWNEGIRDDLSELQNIPHNKSIVIGSSQFCYIYEFLKLHPENLHRPYKFDYIYFGFATGVPALVKQELNIINQISETLSQSRSLLQLVVRPYPVLRDWSHYRELDQLPNVVIDDSFKTNNLMTEDKKILEKFLKIHFAKCFLHLGTTLGLEVCFTRTPSFILDFGYNKNGNDRSNIKHFIHQYQNDKYLINQMASNVIRSKEQLKHIIDNIESKKYIDYNKKIADSFEIISFNQFAERIISI